MRLGQEFQDGKAVPDRLAVVRQQDRHLAGKGIAQDLRLRVGLAQLDVDLLEGNARLSQGQPGPQAPARGILVADHQPIRHGMLLIPTEAPIMPPSFGAEPFRGRSCCTRGVGKGSAPRALFRRSHPWRQEKRPSSRRPPLPCSWPADAKRRSIPVWLARNAGWLREAPLTPSAEGVGGGARLQGRRQEAPAAAGRRGHPRRRRARARRGARWRSHGQAGAGRRPAARRAAGRLLSSRRQARRPGAGGRRLGPRRLSLSPLQVWRGRGGCTTQGSARRRSGPRALALSKGSGSGAISSTRRPATWGRRSWRMPPASSPSSTVPACRASSATICWPRISR